MAAREVVLKAIENAMKKTPSEAPRASKARQYGQAILDKIQGERGSKLFDKFCLELVSYFRSQISSVTTRYKANTSKRQKLWSTFHVLRTKDQTLSSLWKNFVSELDISTDDHLFEQTMYQEVFEYCMQEYFTDCSSRNPTEHKDVNLTADELNVVRYVGGYVARSVLRKYEKKMGENEVYSQFIDCLGEMAVEGEGDDVLTYTRKWFELVNRGGLYPLNDEAFTLFANIEICVQTLLPKYMVTSDSQKESFHKSVHDKVLKNDDVLFHWTLLSQEIDDPEDAEILLKDLISLWVTVRGYSITALWMETYKSTEKKSIQKSTGLRKSISGT